MKVESICALWYPSKQSASDYVNFEGKLLLNGKVIQELTWVRVKLGITNPGEVAAAELWNFAPAVEADTLKLDIRDLDRPHTIMVNDQPHRIAPPEPVDPSKTIPITIDLKAMPSWIVPAAAGLIIGATVIATKKR